MFDSVVRMSSEQMIHGAFMCLAFLLGYAYRVWVDRY